MRRHYNCMRRLQEDAECALGEIATLLMTLLLQKAGARHLILHLLRTLQAHAPELFACGIAKSGAYNRTLTPFGFQAEERTIWQAPEVYNAMSPFMQVSS